MKKFAVVISEINTQQNADFSTVWCSVTEKESLKTLVPLNLNEDFESFGQMPTNQAEIVAQNLKKILRYLEVESIEHTIAAD